MATDCTGRSAPARLLILVLAAQAGCQEQIQLLAPAGPECEHCPEGEACIPAADGIVCAEGACMDGVCTAAACPTSERFVAVSAGQGHTCALGFSGQLYCWGWNAQGQLGLGNGPSRGVPTAVTGTADWERLTAGWRHTCGQRRDNSAWCWGDNRDGQLGLGNTEVRTEPTVLASDPTAWVQVAGGRNHSCGIDTNGALWCWGRNQEGQLGIDNSADQVAPTPFADAATQWRQIAAGERHSCAVSWDGRLLCWGRNEDGVLGIAGSGSRAPPTQLAALRTWVGVAAGERHSCALDSDNQLFCWGRNGNGEVGAAVGLEVVREPQALSAAGAGFSHLALGERHSCAVARDGTLWCWGWNQRGQLGLGDQRDRPMPERVGTAVNWTQVASGNRHTCALRSSGHLFCWGENEHGQLGLGDVAARLLPHMVCPPQRARRSFRP